MAVFRSTIKRERENGHVTEVVTLMEGEWSYYRSGRFNGGGQFKGGRMVVTVVARGRIVMLQRWSLNTKY